MNKQEIEMLQKVYEMLCDIAEKQETKVRYIEFPVLGSKYKYRLMLERPLEEIC